MASSDSGPRERGGAAQTGADDSRVPEASAAAPPAAQGQDRLPRRFRGSGVSAAERDRMLDDLRRIDFPAALRGYDRSAVDRYVERVNRMIAELEISASPESAVRHALDEVSEETRGLLQRAHQTAEEIIAKARVKVEEQLEAAQLEAEEVRQAAEDEAAASREASARESARQHAIAQRDAEELREDARREVQQMLEAADVRGRELARSAETIWRERRRLIEDVRTVGDQLVAIGETEARRFTQYPGDGPGDGAVGGDESAGDTPA